MAENAAVFDNVNIGIWNRSSVLRRIRKIDERGEGKTLFRRLCDLEIVDFRSETGGWRIFAIARTATGES